MNSVSWLLYAAEVVTSIKGAIAAAGMMAVIGLVFSWTPFLISGGDPEDWAQWLKTLPRKFGLLVAILGAVFVVIPSNNTIMLIAASEIGETVLASKEAQRMGGEAGQLASDSLRLLRKYISEQLAETDK